MQIGKITTVQTALYLPHTILQLVCNLFSSCTLIIAITYSNCITITVNTLDDNSEIFSIIYDCDYIVKALTPVLCNFFF